MRASIAILLASFHVLVSADSHDFGACQVRTDGPIDHAATVRVAANCNNNYIPGPAGWGLSDETAIWARRDSGAGPRFEGLFLQNGDQHTGGIDGDTLHRLCREAGAGDSSAFSCNRYQINSDNRVHCVQ
ncbi:hypothetical protein C7974DRAFT_388078 [Boeremia exigua]|uniref:uncharacterized protein n=1 Tax=Boeremia exigua TaxID=749465 RepID=UPI001E8D1445|nr:uncharacterized protein C7974DRAFT_388078 [Boeremia exigua]KAH6639239.1 hypothetical protein C7974DRAFT_388078 [Boeremia exigua]